METRVSQKIRLFKMIDALEPHQTITARRDDPDWPILHKWLREGVITGDSGSSEEGDVFFGLSITSHGREVFAKLTDSTSFGFIQKFRFAFYKWFFGILAVVIAAWIIKTIIG